MPYDPKAVANTLLDLAAERKIEITPLKLLKLLYFAHGWHLALGDQPLLNEQVEAWKFGPVVPSIYHAFKEFKMGPITGRAKVVSITPDGEIAFYEPREDGLRDFLSAILNVYGKRTGFQLSELTHLPGTPWYEAWEGGGKLIKGKDIDNEKIKAHFKEKRSKQSKSD